MADREAPSDDLPLDESETGAIGVLAESVGVWDVDLEIRPGPEADVITTAGVSTSRLVGGRWLVTDLITDSGFDGHGVYGWDAIANAYTAVWVDSAGGGMAHGTGRWDPATRTTTYEMAVDIPGGTVRYRETTEAVDDDTRAYRNLMPVPDNDGGGEYEAIKAAYRRRS